MSDINELILLELSNMWQNPNRKTIRDPKAPWNIIPNYNPNGYNPHLSERTTAYEINKQLNKAKNINQQPIQQRTPRVIFNSKQQFGSLPSQRIPGFKSMTPIQLDQKLRTMYN